MITDIASFLRYFDAVHRRAVRDIAALPPAAATWQPPAREGEAGWNIGQLVMHMGAARLYFASAYRGEGWVLSQPQFDVTDQAGWVPYLEAAAAEFQRAIAPTPDEWLTRRIEMIDTPGSLAGWRVLMMMLEHDVHHRSQIDTYAGIEGWDVPQIFGRTAESIGTRQDEQRAKYRGE